MGDFNLKIFRRAIIVICSILLIPLLISSIPEGKYFNKDLQDKVKSSDAKVIEVNKEWKIDNDTIIIQRIITTDKNTYIRIRYVQSQIGWSFPFSAIELYDDKGKKNISGGEAKGKLWGEDGINVYDRLNDNCKEITLKLQWYDRKMELKIPYAGSGNI